MWYAAGFWERYDTLGVETLSEIDIFYLPVVMGG